MGDKTSHISFSEKLATRKEFTMVMYTPGDKADIINLKGKLPLIKYSNTMHILISKPDYVSSITFTRNPALSGRQQEARKKNTQ